MSAVTTIATNEQVIGKFVETWVLVILVLILVIWAAFLINRLTKKQMEMQQKHNEAIVGVITERMTDISESIRRMVTYIWRSVLNAQETVVVMKAIMHEHIFRKLSFFSNMLYKNHLDEHVEDKKEMIKTEIERITNEEIHKLSEFNSRAWDLWEYLRNVDLDSFSDRCVSIIFGSGEPQKKLEFLKSLMEKYVNDLIQEVEINIHKNTF